MLRGRRLEWAGSRRVRRLCAGALGLLATLFALDLAFPPPISRALTVSPVVLDHDGVWLRAFTTPSDKWRLATRLSGVDPEFLHRVVKVEDAHFWIHPGVNPLALARATFAWLRTGRVTSGGSTLTMQLARLLEPRPRTIPSKLIEIVRALQIERRLTKPQILSLYLTMTPYGGNLEGVRAASRAYFRRDPVGLSDSEMALLIALPQAPEARRPDRRPAAAKQARNRVLAKFAALRLIDRRRAAEAMADPIPGRTPFPVRADHIAARIVSANPNEAIITSTLDVRMQTELERLVRARVQPLSSDVSAAALVVEIKGRRIRASVGGAGLERAGGYIDMTRAIRSPGSTLKPFIYALAFDDGFAAPETLVEDAPRRFGGYLPENFDRRYHGDVRLSEALQHSLNLPAVATLDRVGPGRFEAALAASGARPIFPSRDLVEPGLALALGGVGLTLEQLSTLYAALGDNGIARPLTMTTEPGPGGWSYRLMKPQTTRKILGILASAPSPPGRAPAWMSQGAPQVAFKTGTSYGFRDAWSIGVGGGYVAAVWIGRPDGGPRPDATGRSEALPLLFDIFDRIHPETNDIPFISRREKAPAGLARLEDRSRGEAPVILFPPNGAEVLVDSVGAAARGVALAARGGRAPLAWYAEGSPAPREPNSGRTIWRPSTEGFHEVDVVDADGRRATARVRIRTPR